MRLPLIGFIGLMTALLLPLPAKADEITLSMRDAFCTLIHLDRYLSIERFVIRYDPSRCPPPTEFASVRSMSAQAITYEAMNCFAENLQEFLLNDNESLATIENNCEVDIKSVLLGETSLAETLQMGSPACHEGLIREDEPDTTNPLGIIDGGITISTQCVR